jgi:hypothetical protein
MAQNITKIDDYKGFTQLPIADVETHFNEFAFEIEKDILRGKESDDFGLLGDENYINLLADLDGNNDPQTAPWINLIDGINYVSSNGRKTVYGGVRSLLTYFVFSEYVKQYRVTFFQASAVNMTYENGDNAAIKQTNYEAHRRWNKGVGLFNGETYDYLIFNQSSFPNWDFTRQSKYIIHGI